MARRTISQLGDLLEYAESIPWWIGVLLAAGSYLFLNWLASMDLNYSSSVKDFGYYIGKEIYKIKSAAMILQYVIPISIGAGALLSGINQFRKPVKSGHISSKMSPDCPNCGNKMVIRIAKRGANPGSRFWGCSTFPKCKETLNINEK